MLNKRNWWQKIGIVLLAFGLALFCIQFILLGVNISLDDTNLLIYASGITSIGLGFLAIGLSKETDKKYTNYFILLEELLKTLMKNFEDSTDIIEKPSGNIVVTPKPAIVHAGVSGKILVRATKFTKKTAQKRLAEDTKKVGYVRGKIYPLEDGSWGIKWGGEYPL